MISLRAVCNADCERKDLTKSLESSGKSCISVGNGPIRFAILVFANSRE